MEAGYDIKTEPFKMSGKRYMYLLISIFGKGWIIAGCLVFTAFIILGIFIDFRFYFLSLMWLCLVFPMMLAFLYFFYGLKPVSSLNTTEHLLEFSENEIKVILFLKPEKKFPVDKDEDENSVEKIISTRVLNLKREKIYKKMVTGDGIILFYKGEGKEFLWIPLVAFTNLSEIKKII